MKIKTPTPPSTRKRFASAILAAGFALDIGTAALVATAAHQTLMYQVGLSSTMSNALPAPQKRGKSAGRDAASTTAYSPVAKKRPSHLRAVSSVVPCSDA